MELTAQDRPDLSHTGIRQRCSNYSNLIRVASALGVVAFHVSAPGSQAIRMTVDLFFVTAGINMASALKRNPSAGNYTWSRARRLLPEIAVIWLISLMILLWGSGTAGMAWFVGTAPFFLQNLTPPFFDYDLPKDAVFGALWFAGALLQLQVILYASRRVWERAPPAIILTAVFGFGLLFRIAFSLACGHSLRALSVGEAVSLYCMPFCHLESITLGVLLGRGALPRLGRRLPVFLVVVVTAGVINLWLSTGQITHGLLGYEFPLRANASHLWAYPLLALTAASLCARDGIAAVAVDGPKCPAWLARLLSEMAPLTYGIYAFHGLIIATGINGASHLSGMPASVSHTLLFVITLIEATFLSVAFRWGRERLFPGPQSLSPVGLAVKPAD